MRQRFDEQLETLNNELIEMGALIERAIASAVKALTEQDIEQAQRAIDFDDVIDQKESDIESLCLKLLLQQQPVARDLRLISSALKMITDMERIGDQAKDISEITMILAGTPYIKKLKNISEMAVATIKMVTDSVDAFVRRDLELAQAVIDYDDVVDDLFVTVKTDLIKMISQNEENGSQAVDLLMVAKYFERIGDHATNIAEWVVFAITGKHKHERIL
ncbi:MAG: phosphate signaling complex protein PhoU [Eubacteriales bacterium]